MVSLPPLEVRRSCCTAEKEFVLPLSVTVTSPWPSSLRSIVLLVVASPVTCRTWFRKVTLLGQHRSSRRSSRGTTRPDRPSPGSVSRENIRLLLPLVRCFPTPPSLLSRRRRFRRG